MSVYAINAGFHSVLVMKDPNLIDFLNICIIPNMTVMENFTEPSPLGETRLKSGRTVTFRLSDVHAVKINGEHSSVEFWVSPIAAVRLNELLFSDSAGKT